MSTGNIPTEDDVLGYIPTISNWGRWGADDELGTMNNIGPDQIKYATSLVKEGISVSCARTITTERAPDVVAPVLHYMTGSGESSMDTDTNEFVHQQSSGDFIGMAFHGHWITHIDSLSHMFWNGKMYNNRPASMVTTREGATKESIEVLKNGVIGRGVLLDVARSRGVDWMKPGEYILPEELDKIAHEQNIELQQGDILLIRTGHYKRRTEEGPRSPEDGYPGLQAACIPWIRTKNIAALGGDTVSDSYPSGYPKIRLPIHQIALPYMGLWLIDNCNLEELSQACHRLNRWEFLFTLCPLRIKFGTGSPVNPIAIM